MPTKRKTSLQCSASPQTCQPAKADRDERDQRHQAGDDPVAGLVGDRLDVRGKGSCAALHAWPIIRAARLKRAVAFTGAGIWSGRWRSPAPRRCDERSRPGSPSGPSRSSSGTGRGCRRPATAGPTFYVRSPRAAAHVLRAPGQLGLGRAYVSGEIEVDDMDAVIGLLESWKPPPLDGRRQAQPAARRGARRRPHPARRAARRRAAAERAAPLEGARRRAPSATTTTSPTSSSRSSSTTR